VISKLKNAKKLKDVKADDYDAIFYIGGHGPVLDLATDASNINLLNQVYPSLIEMFRANFPPYSSGLPERSLLPCAMDQREIPYI
jgi:hypothetical protein